MRDCSFYYENAQHCSFHFENTSFHREESNCFALTIGTTPPEASPHIQLHVRRVGRALDHPARPPVARHKIMTDSKKRRVSNFGTAQRLNSDNNTLLTPQAPPRLPGRKSGTLPACLRTPKVIPPACSSTEQSRSSVDMATLTSHPTTKGLSRCQQAMTTSFAFKCYQQQSMSAALCSRKLCKVW